VADLSSLSDYHVLDWLKAHEDAAIQWTEDARCRFLPTEKTPVEPHPLRRAEAAVLVTNSG